MWEDDLEPYINKDKRYMTDEERIRHLEHGIRELKKQIHNLKKEKAELKEKLKLTENDRDEREVKARDMIKENKLLEQAINELMIQCDIKYFRFIDKEFYKQESPLSFISDKN